eukprot:523172_1
MGFRTLVVLQSSCVSDPLQGQDQTRLEHLLKAKRVAHKVVDGNDPDQLDIREQMFSCSGLRGAYPQVFIESEGEYTFVGFWSDIESMNEVCDLPLEILKKNPQIKTFDQEFAAFMQKR